ANLFFALRKTGRLKEAVVEGKKAIALDPGDKYTVYNLAITYLDMQEFDEALTCLNRYLTLETEPSLRKNAENVKISLMEDKKYAQDPTSKGGDYLDALKRAGHT